MAFPRPEAAGRVARRRRRRRTGRQRPAGHHREAGHASTAHSRADHPGQGRHSYREELLALHGVGPKAVRVLTEALAERGMERQAGWWVVQLGQGGAEGDPVLARAQAGAVTGSRNNATMATRPDGVSSIMSMFLWQPLANSFYGPCAAGDYDVTIIGHEYTHMIENRLIGKGDNRSGFHAGAMGESWSDCAVEQLLEHGATERNAIEHPPPSPPRP